MKEDVKITQKRRLTKSEDENREESLSTSSELISNDHSY